MTRWTPATLDLSDQLAHLMGQRGFFSEAYAQVIEDTDADFLVASRTTQGVIYPMQWTPEGYAVHRGKGCEHEIYGGPLGCWHSKEYAKMVQTQALVRAESVLTPAPIDFNREQLDLIKRTIAKGATDDELSLFVTTCRRTGLDPFMRQIYAVKRYDSKEKREVMAIQVGIDGLRLIAQRTGKYGGMDPLEWLDGDGVWSPVWTGPTPKHPYPIAARCTVYRTDAPRGFPAVCRWDSYAQTFGAEHKLGSMWEKMPDVMIGKCAESLSHRRAFPAEMSALAVAIDNDYDPSEDTEVSQAAAEALSAAHERNVTAGVYADAIEGTVVQPDPHADQIPPIAQRPAASRRAPAPSQATLEACEHEPKFDADSTLMVCSKCGTVLEEPPVR